MAQLILRPADFGDYSNLTPTGATTGYECTQDVVSNADGSYVSPSIALTDTDDTYAVYTDSIKVNDTIYSITVNAVVKTTNATLNDSAVRMMIGIPSEVQFAVGTTNVLTTSYVLYSYTWNNSIVTSAPWNFAEIAELQVGVRLTSGVTGVARCTQVYAEINYNPTTDAILLAMD